MDYKKLLEDFKKSSNNKNISNLLIVILVLVLLLVTLSAFKGTTTTLANNEQVINKTSEPQNLNINVDDEKEIENKLKSTLELIDGVGKVETMVYFEGGEEQVPAMNVNDSTNYTEEKDTTGGTRKTTQNNSDSSVVLTNNGDKTEPLIVKSFKPKVSGVIIVAEGANDKVIQYKISQAVIKLFDIPADKVNVYAMKK